MNVTAKQPRVDLLESPIQAAIVDALRRLGCLVKVSTSGQRSRGYTTAALGKGCPDLLCLIDGHVVFIETKRSRGGVVSDAQHEWHTEWRQHGGRVEVINTVEAALALVLDIRQGRRPPCTNNLEGHAR